MQQEIEFYEKQICPLWLRILISVVFPLFLIVLFVDNQQSTLSFILTSILFIGVILITWFASLKIIINSDGIYVKIFPMFKFKLYKWENISNIEIRKQEIIRDNRLSLRFGFRLRFRFNFFQNPIMVYNFAGRYCLQFVWKGFHSVKISTNQPVEIEEILEKLGKINKQIDN